MMIQKKCQPIQLILSDVDGILTDGGVEFNNQGIETKRFNIRDGLGIKLWQQVGYHFGLITSRTSQIVKIRATELGIDLVRQGITRKLSTLDEIARSLELDYEQICYIGDDFPDLPCIKAVGFGVTVPEASEEILAAADYVTQSPGGRGAVRDLIETILKAQRRWDGVIQQYM